MNKKILGVLIALFFCVFLIVSSIKTFADDFWTEQSINGIGANISKDDYILPSGLSTYEGTSIKGSNITVILNGWSEKLKNAMLSVPNENYILISNSTKEEDMTQNREHLQKIIDMVSVLGGGSVIISEGIYYFNPSDYIWIHQFGNFISHCITVRSNVTLSGTLDSEGKIATWLSPYGVYNYACNMFEGLHYPVINADFKDFGIDAKDCINTDIYLCNGKGFYISPMKNCDWYNVIVKNTGGTGFGVDNGINCTITNCTAIGCGKDCTSSGDDQSGASGFGIGYGLYSDNESIILSKCLALNNRRYGIFFENQYRYKSEIKRYFVNDLTASNCISAGNLYNFGGECCFGSEYINCQSLYSAEELTGKIVESKRTQNILDYHFGVGSFNNCVDYTFVN